MGFLWLVRWVLLLVGVNLLHLISLKLFVLSRRVGEMSNKLEIIQHWGRPIGDLVEGSVLRELVRIVGAVKETGFCCVMGLSD